ARRAMKSGAYGLGSAPSAGKPEVSWALAATSLLNFRESGMRIASAEPRQLKTEVAPKPAAPAGGTQANTVKTPAAATGASGVSTFTPDPGRPKVNLLGTTAQATTAAARMGPTTPAADPVQE